MAPSIVDLTKDESTTRPEVSVPSKPKGFSNYPELRKALKRIQLPALLKVVESLCESSETTAKLMHDRLILPASTELPYEQKNLKKRTASQILLGHPVDRVEKRPRYRFMTCIRCGIDFNIEDNDHRECQYHPGEAEMDDDANTWVDMDWLPGMSFEFDTCEESQKNGFTWTCCEKVGTTPFCKTGRHRPEAVDDWNGRRFADDDGQSDSDEATDAETEAESDSEDYETVSEASPKKKNEQKEAVKE